MARFSSLLCRWLIGLTGILLLDGCSTILQATSKDSENYGKRTWGTVVDDQTIESRAKANIRQRCAGIQGCSCGRGKFQRKRAACRSGTIR